MSTSNEQLKEIRREIVNVIAKDAPPGVATALTAMVAFSYDIVKALSALKARVAELEKSPINYDGVHREGKSYSRGTFVTFNGALWHANYATTAKPGNSSDWTLAVKKGRDGKDAA